MQEIKNKGENNTIIPRYSIDNLPYKDLFTKVDDFDLFKIKVH